MDSSTMNGELEAILSGEPAGASIEGDLTWPDRDQLRSTKTGLCRLCADPCGDVSMILDFKHISEDTSTNPLTNVADGTKSDEGGKVDDANLMRLIDKTLPIKVSQSDPLPKQVCLKCVGRLKESYSFVMSVINAETRLQSMAETKCFCASEASEEEEAAKSPEVVPSTGLVRVALPSGPKYCCPLCSAGVVAPCSDPPVPLVKKLRAPERAALPSRSNVAWDGTIIKMERDEIEPTPEELERSYRDLFEVRDWRTQRVTYPRSQPAARRGYKGRPRGRPRGRSKMIPRGKRGTKRLTTTTVERILELSGRQSSDTNDVVRVRSGGDRLHADALTQCLLCEGWLPGMAACLQHSLANHTDCGVFLCPRCQQDDFPGEFELIQHFQEHHCPDLELCEGSDDDVGPSDNAAVATALFDAVAPETRSMYAAEVARPASRLSAGTGSEEIKQNGDSSLVISQELSLSSLLEDKDVEDVDMSVTEPPPEDPEDAEEDREYAEEQDTKFEDRKDPEDPEGGGGSLGGNLNSMADDSSSFDHGDSSSQNTQPETKNEGGGASDCGNSLNLTRSLSGKTSFRLKKGVNYGRKPKRKRLRSLLLSNTAKSFFGPLSSNCPVIPWKDTALKTVDGNYEDIVCPKSTCRKRLTKTPSYIHRTGYWRK